MGLHYGGTLNPFLQLLIGIVPGAVWLLIFFALFRKNSSLTLSRLFLVFGSGALITIVALLLEVGVESVFSLTDTTFVLMAISAIFVVAPIEEAVKFFLLQFGVLKQLAVKKVFDPVVCGMAIGLGFATVENVLLVFQETNITFLVLRALTATLLHAGTTGIVGFYLGLAQKDPQRTRTFALQGIFIASLFHAAYNFIMTLQQTSALFLALLLLTGIFFFLLFALPELRKSQDMVEENS